MVEFIAIELYYIMLYIITGEYLVLVFKYIHITIPGNLLNLHVFCLEMKLE